MSQNAKIKKPVQKRRLVHPIAQLSGVSFSPQYQLSRHLQSMNTVVCIRQMFALAERFRLCGPTAVTLSPSAAQQGLQHHEGEEPRHGGRGETQACH